MSERERKVRTCKPPVMKSHWIVHEIHERLEKIGMSRGEFSVKSGVSERTMDDWWNGTRFPSLFLIECSLTSLDLELQIKEKVL